MSLSGSQNKSKSAIFAQRCAAEASRYLSRRGFAGLPTLPAPDPALDLVVIVPALAEPDVVTTLESLAAATRPGIVMELLLVVNAPDNASAAMRRDGAQCLADARAWMARRQDQQLVVHILDCRDLPADQAGVGLARKIGMDAALTRLALSDSGRGVIVSLDADCRVAQNYLVAIEDYFRRETAALGATIYFEHPLDNAPAGLHAAIIDYELHLRCYRHGLQAAGSSYASYTVGSAFAVRSEIYAQEGGMNRRAAGEDFYFINKLLKRGRLDEINNTTVFPSPRVSDRVPFGTGAAMRHSGEKVINTYAAAVYRELETLQTAVLALVRQNQPLPSAFAPFLDAMGFDSWLDKARANVASAESLAAQLTRWLDSFHTMKFVNWLTETRYPRVPVETTAREILSWKKISPAQDTQGLLEQFRELDRAQRQLS